MGRTYEPFALQVGLETVYIVTAPKDVSEVLRKADTLQWHEHLNQIFLNFGFDPKSLKRAWMKPVEKSPLCFGNNPVNPKQLSIIHFVENIYAQQLLPGVQMDKMTQSFKRSLESSLQWPNMGFFGTGSSSDCQTVSLKTYGGFQRTRMDAFLWNTFILLLGSVGSKSSTDQDLRELCLSP